VHYSAQIDYFIVSVERRIRLSPNFPARPFAEPISASEAMISALAEFG
jgi:hypothetical protein